MQGKSRNSPKNWIWVALALVACVALWFALVSSFDSNAYARGQARAVQSVKESDPRLLLAAGRELLAKRAGRAGEIDVSDPIVPEAIRKLRPDSIWFQADAVYVNLGDIMNPFGFTVFKAGATGRDVGCLMVKAGQSREWIEGLWVFHDGQLWSPEAHASPGGIDPEIWKGFERAR